MRKKNLDFVLYWLAICLLTLAACTYTVPAQTPSQIPPTIAPESTREPFGTSIPFATIAQEAPLGDKPVDPLYTLVVHADSWDALFGLLPDKAIEAGIQAGPASNELIVIAFGGVKGNSGHSISVERIVQENDQLIVTVSQIEPGPDDIVEDATTLPYHLVTLSKKDLRSTWPLTVIFRDSQGSALSSKTIIDP